MSRRTGIAEAHKIVFERTFNYLRMKKEWKWLIISNSNLGMEVIAASSQGYLNKEDAEYNLKSIYASVWNHYALQGEDIVTDRTIKYFD